MNIVIRQTAFGALLSLIFFGVISSLYFTFFPLESWNLLWEREIFDFPVIIFLAGICLLIGVIFGMSSGVFLKKQIKLITDALYDLEAGNEITEASVALTEMKVIRKRINSIHSHMKEQIKQSQKLANEKAEVQEKRIQEIVSQERNRLARELHDSVSQQLFAASMLMSAINESKDDSNTLQTSQLKLVEGMIHQSQLEMRALLLHLRPAPLKGKSLHEGIQELLTELENKVPLEIQWKLEPVGADKGIEDHLFRILQESVSNTLRHSKASSLEVLLIRRDDFIIMRVMDDGVGFDVDEAKSGSYGMQNMQERALEIGGTLKLVSVKNKGSRLEVKVPVMVQEG
ncbi:NarL family two-component system sensor histidine kinase LiaS [Peribacillus deserti]|uniref:Sensor histidine kinase n=1 Tax=Peribacillus deserti TaxID=673318 RepID=A0ABS2QBR0_9BACI|nr:sensor histidine kinase [Peribacillus deserti]MBM7690603.1 NarL family two-component system sensor histidine kinase LiaS [Peribacillus deserti]